MPLVTFGISSVTYFIRLQPTFDRYSLQPSCTQAAVENLGSTPKNMGSKGQD
jgi:hypothetical protein